MVHGKSCKCSYNKDVVGQYLTVIHRFIDHKYCSHQDEKILSALTGHERAVDHTVIQEVWR